MLTVSFEPADDVNALAIQWHLLEQRGRPSYFQSWHWIGAWLASLPADIHRRVLVARGHDNAPVGLAVLVQDAAKQWHLHETGTAALDAPTIEDNAIMTAAGTSDEVTTAALDFLLEKDPGAFSLTLPGIDHGLAELTRIWAARRGLGWRLHRRSIRPYVDLEKVRKVSSGYLSCLSPNTRQAVRRSLRLFGSAGPVTLSVAATLSEAEHFLSKLKDLHQAVWTKRGEPGAFAYPAFEALHNHMLRCSFSHGVIQLCRIASGNADIGYLYNLIWNGRVYAYQSGFDYRPDNRMKPGLVCHTLAIEHALAAGHGIYDFMAGPGQHKSSLSNEADHLYWVTVERPTLAKSLARRSRQVQGKVRSLIRGG